MLHLTIPDGDPHAPGQNASSAAEEVTPRSPRRTREEEVRDLMREVQDAHLQLLLADHQAAVRDVLVKHCELATETIVQLTMNFQKRASGHDVSADTRAKPSLHLEKQPAVDLVQPSTASEPPEVALLRQQMRETLTKAVDLVQPAAAAEPPEVAQLRQQMRQTLTNIQTVKTEVAGAEAELKKLWTENVGLCPQMLGLPSNEVQPAHVETEGLTVDISSRESRVAAQAASASPKRGSATNELQSRGRSVKAKASAAVHPAEPEGKEAVEAEPAAEATQPATNHPKAKAYEHPLSGSNFMSPRKASSSSQVMDKNPIIGKRFRKPAPVFVDVEAIKTKLRMEMSRPDYNVSIYYHKSGCFSQIATSTYFETLTLLVISANALWIAVDIDLNEAAILPLANTPFIIADNLFCLYFSVEWFIRFMSFKYKLDVVKDPWFVFDTFLCAVMVFETWLISLAFLFFDFKGSGALGNASVLKGFRLMRMVRMARILRLLNALPELMILIKGMAVATRAVSCTVLVLVLIVYVFSIIFRQVTDGTPLGKTHFSSVPTTMRLLILQGTVPDLADLTMEISDASAIYAVVFLFFVLVVTLTVMNMLVGVLVGVVNAVASLEKEQLTLNFVRENLVFILKSVQQADANASYNRISKADFGALLQRTDAIQAFSMMGVDVLGLVDLTDFIFRKHNVLQFSEFMDLVMQLRGSNQATVKDIVDLRKFIINELKSAIRQDGARASSKDDPRNKLKNAVADLQATVAEPARKENKLVKLMNELTSGANHSTPKKNGFVDLDHALNLETGQSSASIDTGAATIGSNRQLTEDGIPGT